MKNIDQLLIDLEAVIPTYLIAKPSISEGSVGWHIQHSVLVIIQIAKTIEVSNPDEYQWKFNYNRTMVFLLNRFPRGKAKAPASVIPSQNISEQTLKEGIQEARQKISNLKFSNPNKYFVHPFFGKLNIKQTIRFFGIHTLHHLKIINDIIKA